VLGRLNPDYFLGGEMKLYPDLAREAIRQHIAEPMGLSIEQAAGGVIRVVNANMIRGISTSLVKRGYDLREFSLLPFGGAGALHAVELAQEMNMRRVIVPPYPGTLSALGVLVADTRYDYVATFAREEGTFSPDELQQGLQTSKGVPTPAIGAERRRSRHRNRVVRRPPLPGPILRIEYLHSTQGPTHCARRSDIIARYHDRTIRSTPMVPSMSGSSSLTCASPPSAKCRKCGWQRRTARA
jgi:hypothetical protein